jgi:hypothetical protein
VSNGVGQLDETDAADHLGVGEMYLKVLYIVSSLSQASLAGNDSVLEYVFLECCILTRPFC